MLHLEQAPPMASREGSIYTVISKKRFFMGLNLSVCHNNLKEIQSNIAGGQRNHFPLNKSWKRRNQRPAGILLGHGAQYESRGWKPTTAPREAQGEKPRMPGSAAPAEGVLRAVGVPEAAPQKENNRFTDIHAPARTRRASRPRERLTNCNGKSETFPEPQERRIARKAGAPSPVSPAADSTPGLTPPRRAAAPTSSPVTPQSRPPH